MDDETTGVEPFDLNLPARTLLPHQAPLLFDPRQRARAAAAAERAAEQRRHQVAESLLAETCRWRDLHVALCATGDRIGAAVLEVHQPQTGYDKVVCSECMTDDCYEATSAPFPCRTFNVVESEAEGPDGGRR